MKEEKKIEESMISWGKARYRKAQEIYKKHGLNSELPAYKKLGREVHVPIEQAINKFFVDNARPNAPVPVWLPFIWDLEPGLVAFLGVKVLFDILPSEPFISDASFQVAKALEDEVRVRYFKEYVSESDWLLLKRDQKDVLTRNKFVNKFWDKERKYHKQGRYKRFELWSQRNKIMLGSWLIELIRMQTNLYHVKIKYSSLRQKRKTLAPNKDLYAWVDKYDKNCEVIRPFYLATPKPPIDWVDNYGGGYNSEGLPTLPIMKIKNNDGIKHRDLSVAYEPLNRLQRVAWKINPKMLNLMQWAWSKGLTIGGMEKSDLIEPLETIPNLAETDPEAFSEWKRRAKEIYEYNFRSNGQRMRCLKILNVAKRYSEMDEFYFPYQMDYRGRVYAIPSYVNPQSCDFGRSVLQFAEGVAINNYEDSRWLRVHGANVFGVKGSFVKRLDWVDKKKDLILECANDPLECTWWHEASDPWAFIHFCFEFAEFKEQGWGFKTKLPCHMDASCNAIQILSLLTRDEQSGHHVNLLPDRKPQDIYQEVADQVYDRLMKDKSKNSLAGDWLKFGIDRSFTKKIVMCKPFGMNGYTSKDALEEAVVKKLKQGIGSPFSKEDYNEAMIYLASLINDKANALIQPHIELMRWFKRIARTDEPLTWTTPFGLEIVQALYDQTIIKVHSILNMQNTILAFNNRQKGVSSKRMARAIVPNFIHSLDASVMMELACKSNYSIASIHDSFATQSPNGPKMHQQLREIYTEHFSDDLINKFKDEIEAQRGCTLEDSPELGTLDVSALNDCQYIFS